MSEKTKIEKMYRSFTDSLLPELQANEFYKYFLNSVKSGACNISLYERYIERIVDLRWVEKIENTIVALDIIIRNPQRFIKNEEEIVPIELVRQVSTESIRHLAQHTSMIAMVKGDEVTPQRMLNIVKEESFETYENRFLYTLLAKLDYFLDKRLQALSDGAKKSQDVFEFKMDGECDAGKDRLTYSLSMAYVTPHVELSENDLKIDADVSNMTPLQRVERVRRILYDFRSAPLMRDLQGCAMIRPPLNMTNVLTKNQNFRKAVDLWMFIEQYDEVGYKVTHVERQADPSQTYLDEMFSSLALQYVLMKKNSGTMLEIADYTERRSEITPNIVKKEIEQLIDTYDLEIDEIKRVFINQIDIKQKKKQLQTAKTKAAIARALAAEAENLKRAKEERALRLERRRKMAEKQAELERKRLEKERLEAERLEAEHLEAERLEAERLEAERLEAERLEAERLEAERLEAERLEAERLEAERLEAERLEAERLEAERLEAERRRANRITVRTRAKIAAILSKPKKKKNPSNQKKAASAEAPKPVTPPPTPKPKYPPKPPKKEYNPSRKKQRNKARLARNAKKNEGK